MSIKRKKKVIIAPLNWGWGHVSRCVPIIKEIEALGLQAVLACDGDALVFLKKEFPDLESFELPSYGIKYKKLLKLGLLINFPKLLLAILKEQKVLKKYLKTHKNNVIAVVSDNRLGMYSNSVKSVYITHQLNVKAGVFSSLFNKFHHHFIKKYKECWVPDELHSVYTGELSKPTSLNVKYIGVVSRLKKETISVKYDLLVLLSGIEGQRIVLENLLREELKRFKGSVLFVRGAFAKTDKPFSKNVKVVDYLLSKDLEKAMNSSDVILSRSGYSTVMDVLTLGKKAFYIPAPGQTEQEYLGSYLSRKKYAFSCSQKDFKIEMLKDKKDADLFYGKIDQHLLKNELEIFFKPFLK